MVLRVLCQLLIFIKYVGPQPFVEVVIKGVLGPANFQENSLQPGPSDLLRDDKIITQLDIALGFLGVRTEAELLDLFEGQAAHSDDIEVENGVFGDRGVPHLEEEGPGG